MYKADTTEPVAGAFVHLYNTNIDKAETGADSKLSFESNEFPDLLDVKIVAADLGTAVY